MISDAQKARFRVESGFAEAKKLPNFNGNEFAIHFEWLP